MIHLFPVISVLLVWRSASIVILVFSFVVLVFVTTRLSRQSHLKVPYYHVCVQMNGYLKNGVRNDSVINCLFYVLVCCKESCDYTLASLVSLVPDNSHWKHLNNWAACWTCENHLSKHFIFKMYG